MIGVRADGRKELVALTDGFRESTESWADLLRGCRRGGMTASPSVNASNCSLLDAPVPIRRRGFSEAANGRDSTDLRRAD
jgi:hypothetical protein